MSPNTPKTTSANLFTRINSPKKRSLLMICIIFCGLATLLLLPAKYASATVTELHTPPQEAPAPDKAPTTNPELGKGYIRVMNADCLSYANYHVVQTVTGGYLAYCGDALYKFNDQGDILWQKKYLGMGSGGTAVRAIHALSDGAFMLVGFTSKFGAGDYDGWVAKIDGNGSLLWQKAYGSSVRDEIYDIAPTADGNYMLVGYTNSQGNQNRSDIWLLKINSNGIKLTQRYFGSTNINGANTGRSIISTADGGYLIVGYTSSFGYGIYDVWVLKLTANLSIQWERAYGTADYERGLGAVSTADGGYVIAGKNSSNNRGLLLKLNSSGGIMWKKEYHDPSQNTSFAKVITTGDGEIVVLGGGANLLKIDNQDGSIIWQKVQNLYSQHLDLIATEDGGLIIAAKDILGNDSLGILVLDADGEINNGLCESSISSGNLIPSTATTGSVPTSATSGLVGSGTYSGSAIVAVDLAATASFACGGPCDLQLEKDGLRTDLTTTGPIAGDEFQYNLTIVNHGGASCPNTVLTDTIPLGLANTVVTTATITDVPFNFTPVPDTRYVWQADTVAAGFHAVITVTGIFSDFLPAGLIRSSAVITSPNDIDPANNASNTTHALYHNNTPPPQLDNWDTRFYENLPPSVTTSHGMALYGGDLYKAGGAGYFPNAHLTRWDGAEWHPVPSLNDGDISGLTVYSNTLYVYGRYLLLEGDINKYPIVQWDGTNWQGVAASSMLINALSIADNGDIYAGGNFSNAGGNTAADHIAKWNGNSWDALGTGLSTVVYTIALAPNGDLYAGGAFTNAGGNAAADHIAKWNGTSWSAVGGGLNKQVHKLLINSAGDLFVRGSFTNAGGVASADYTAKWNGSVWSGLPGLHKNYGRGIFALDANEDLYADKYPNILKWNGSGWDNIASLNHGPVVEVILFDANNDFYVGGSNSSAGRDLVHWKNNQWHPIDSFVLPGNSAFSVFDVHQANDGTIYVAGNAENIGNISQSNYVARWMGDHWQAFPGLLGSGQAMAVALDNNGTLYAGGSFQLVENGDRYGLTRWDGAAWQPVGSIDGYVQSIAFDADNNLYAGGSFTDAGGNVNADKIAKWNGSSWVALGTGLNSTVNTIAIAPNGDIYVGGHFTDAGGNVNADRIAKWNGSSWVALGSGIDNGYVKTIAIAPDGELYVGGNFTSAGNDPNADKIARWNGSSWFAVTDGLNSYVNDLLLDAEGNIYAGGGFTDAGGDPEADYLAKWDGSVWENIGGGTNARINIVG